MYPIYVLASKNKTKLKEETNHILEGTSNYDLIEFDLEEQSLANLLEEINMIPFLYDSKVVLVKSPVVLFNPAKYDAKLIEAFINYIRKPIESTTLVFLLDDLKKVDAKIYKVLKETAIIKELEIPTDISLNDYIMLSFTNDGYVIDTLVVSELIERTKGNIDRIGIEIEKLKTFKANEKTILNTDVSLMVSKELDDNIFELINAVLDKDTLKVMAIFNDLMILNTSETVILTLLIQKFNELYQTKVLTKAGMSKNEIAEVFKVKPGRIYYLQKAASLISFDELKQNINELTNLDYKIKSGLIDKRLGLELFLLK